MKYMIQYWRNGEWHLYTICSELLKDWELAELRYNRCLNHTNTRAYPMNP